MSITKEQLRSKLTDFEIWFNESLFLTSLTTFDMKAYMGELNFSAKRQFARRDKQRSYVGASALSRPDVLLALMYLGYPHISAPYPVKTAMTFHLGDVFEALVVELMGCYGLPITGGQTEVAIPGTPVRGHIDGFCESLDAVVEVKTMAASYWKSFVKQPNNFRGYFTQLAIYKNTTGKSNAFWVCFNKETSEIACVIPDDEELQGYYDTAVGRATILQTFDSIKAVGSLNVPDPKPEVFRKEETGKLMLPTSMRYTPYMGCFYDTYEAKDGYKHDKTYVSRIVNNPDERLHRIEKTKKELIEKYGNPS